MTPAVLAVSAELQPLLAGEPISNVEQLLTMWAVDHGFSIYRRNRVFLGPDVVVKIPFSVATLDEVDPAYRPEQIVIWEGRGPARAHYQDDNWNVDLQVVVQPRYTVMDWNTYHETKTPTGMQLHYAFQHTDTKPDNWGLREDGSPVLFDW